MRDIIPVLILVIYPSVVLAQGELTPVSGAGWVGMVMNGGVLAWLLFFHLPSKDRQISGLVTQVTNLVNINNTSLTAAVTAFQNENACTREAFQQETENIRKSNEENMHKVVATFQEDMKAERGMCEKNIANIMLGMKQLIATTPSSRKEP